MLKKNGEKFKFVRKIMRFYEKYHFSVKNYSKYIAKNKLAFRLWNSKKLTS